MNEGTKGGVQFLEPRSGKPVQEEHLKAKVTPFVPFDQSRP